MLDATEEEITHVKSYMASQAPDLDVVFLQKLHSENILGHVHDAWDVHCGKERWWVITNPTNLYSQEQFPDLDLAVTFHVGLCLRIPKGEKQKVANLAAEPFAASLRMLSEATDALSRAQEVSDYQAIGVRCREVMLAFIDAAQIVVPWTSADPQPQRANLKAWVDHVCNTIMPGETRKERRGLQKMLLKEAWDFDNWLAHSKSSTWFDAEAANTTTEHAVGLTMSWVIRHIRGVPEACPSCGSHRLTPERATDPDEPEVQWERPTCSKCGWRGIPARISEVPEPPESDRDPPEGECIIPTVPLHSLKRPKA